ncbi:acyl carrier protein [Nonomuraea sp. CA-218870]|uniref:acyl carrier protein n=1 Tax=Nonomuraea sp. CA-218870 TaxID=3239998 RepID=UPI003D8F774B
MTAPLTETDVTERLLAFLKERFLSGDPQGELRPDTPLLEWGILTSLNTAILLNHITMEFGAHVPFERVDATAFKDVASIAAMLCAAQEDLSARP